MPERLKLRLQHGNDCYLVSGNYKIIYLIDENLITIATIFDCRQNPVKLKNKNV